ncbi:MAG: methionyl-tRNA formyltransferase [Candidatus Portnoybacteria bacterium]|nr:methionyl-tRNA formyltransferase [Candidatus Portnoybacteria bacterium]MDD4983072.1 methionyl-tRNA formyltransferase [Candidatus Portnoybacteria bacterium]
MTKTQIKIIFMGTPEFAVPILKKLADSEYKPTAVFCAPDKPVGRKQTLAPPPVKILAQKYGLPVYQPKDKNELSYQLKAISYQLIITAAYGLIFSKDVLNAPQYGCINIHPSLLPKYRGPSPIQAVILNGDPATGVTIYKMDEQIDHGEIIANRESRIANRKITMPELSRELSVLGADLLLDTLHDWLAGKITPAPQDESQAAFTKIIAKENGQINWQKSAQEIERQIRAYTPWPGSYSQVANGQSLIVKILEAEISDTSAGKRAGGIFLTADNDLAVQTGNGALIIKKLQLEGGKPLSAPNFLRGHKDIIGKILN